MEIFIDIDDDPLSFIKDSLDIIKDISNKLIEKFNLDLSFNIIFVSSQKQRELNRVYRNLDKTTDVLSFNYDDKELNLLGELYIDPYQALKQAKRYNVSITNELVRLVVHGFLHLVGYDHKVSRDREEMFKLQESIIAEFLD